MKSVAALLAVLTLGLAGCAGDDLLGSASGGYDADSDTAMGRPQRAGTDVQGTLFDGDLLGGTLGSGEAQAGAQLPVNKHIWRSSIETLAFLPLASTDPYGGVIVTDWGAAANAPGERFKVTAFISSAEFKPQSLRVVVNRQRRAQNGEWEAAVVSPDTARQLEDAILTRARQLRAAETGKDS